MIDADLDLDLRVLRYVSQCCEVAVISGPKALATLDTTIKALNNTGTADAVKRLHRGGQIATAMPYRPRAPVRFVITTKGEEMLSRKAAA